MSKVLEIKNLCKKYPAFQLSDVSFEIQEASIMLFISFRILPRR